MDPSTFVFFLVLVLTKALNAQDDNFDITLPTAPIAFYLKSLANSELGVAKLQETLITAATAKKKKQQAHHSKKTSTRNDVLLQMVSEKLSRKWKAFNSHLNSINVQLEKNLKELSKFGSTMDDKVLPPCCATQDQNEAKGCSVIHLGYNGTRTARIASEVFDSLVGAPEGSKRQFFISTDGTTHLEFPASKACGHQAYNWHRQAFVQTVAPDRKHVLIILDRGNAISTLQLDVGRSITGYILESLQVPDQVALLTIDSSRINIASNQACGSWAKASSLTKKVLRSHLSSINRMSYQRYDHATALQKANELIQKVLGTKVDLFYITTAKSLHIKPFLDSYQTLLANSTSAARKLSMKLFLMDSMIDNDEQSHSELLANEVSKLCKTKNVCLAITNIDSTLLLSYKIGDLFDYVETSSPKQNSTLSSLPWMDELGGYHGMGSSLVLTLTSKVRGGSIGMTTQAVIGLDIDYKYIFEDFFYHDYEESYFCILHAKSRSVIYHPRLLSHGAAQDQVFIQGLLFQQLESDKGEYTIEDKLYNQLTGSYESEDKMFNWKHVDEEFVIVNIQKRGTLQNNDADEYNSAVVTQALQSLSVPIQKLFGASVVFHRLDILPAQYQMKLCRHLIKPATLETGSVFLSPKAVTNPYGYLHGSNTEANTILSMMRYLTKAQADDYGTAQKHHLQTVIRDQLQTLAHSVLPVWKNMSFTSGMNNYIVRRFAATDRGLLMTYPGAPFPDELDPLRQEWYLTAKKFPSKVVVTPPRLDQGGAGYILTVSQYVSASGTQNDAGAVIGMDLTLGYINKMLLDTMPICQNMLYQGVRCFIFDHQGYLIIHPSQFDNTQHIEIEGLHLAHVEHLAVSLMLEDQTLVTRRQCKRFSDMTLQRYYHFNTSDSSSSKKKVWENSDFDCWRYKVSMLPGTNLFLAVLHTNSSKCASRADVTFCPHNPTRSCILCNGANEDHLNQHQCESPCQCPLSQCSHAKNDDEVCSPEPQVPPNPDRGMMEDLSLPPCFDTNCKRHSSRSKCFGVIGCAWCEFELKGQEAFCSEEAKCFGGVWGSHWPYDRFERGAKLVENDYFFRKTPSLVPIAGSVLSVILFLGISAYCIRNYDKCLRQPTTLSVVRRHARNGSIIQAASFEEVLEEQNQDELHELSNRNENVATTAAIVSPYRINPGYRRPCIGTDSDNGYSTMTPMGDIDSEIVPYVDSVPSRHRLQRHFQQRQQQAVPSVTSGISSRTSSPTPNPVKRGILPLTTTTPSSSMDSSPIARGTSCQSNIMQLTDSNSSFEPKPNTVSPIGKKNQFVVAATVHMVDTT